MINSIILQSVSNSNTVKKGTSDAFDSQVKSEVEKEMMIPPFVTCCYRRYGKKRGEECLSCMNLVYKILGFTDMNLAKRLRRGVIFIFLMIMIISLGFMTCMGFVIGESTLYVYGGIVLTVFILEFIIFFLFPKYEWVISFVFIISTYVVFDSMVHSTEGILDGALMLGTSFPLFFSFFIFEGLGMRILSFIGWLVNFVAVVIYEIYTFEDSYPKLSKKLEDVSYGASRSRTLVIGYFLSTITFVITSLIKSEVLIRYEKRINKKHNELISQYDDISDEIDIIRTEKNDTGAKLKINKKLFTIDNKGNCHHAIIFINIIPDIKIIEEIGTGGNFPISNFY